MNIREFDQVVFSPDGVILFLNLEATKAGDDSGSKDPPRAEDLQGSF